LSTIDTEEFRALLERERARLTKAVKFLHDDNAGSISDELGEITDGGVDNHLGDAATATYDRELEEGLEEGAQQTLQEVDAALTRIDDGTYGICVVGGEQIPVERLRAIPWARTCIEHA
jgi:DnaK suppressor protein